MATTTNNAGYGVELTLRPLTTDDLEDVVCLDQMLSGDVRYGFFEKRLAAALRRPKKFVYIAACRGEKLVGFLITRLVGGDFGGDESVAVLDAIGVEPEAQGHGVAQALLHHLEDILRHKHVNELQTQTDWTNHGLIKFLDAAGFQRAPRLVLSRDASTPLNL
jgi:ribosomal protein S18 acetylase RimI-like enzyme